MTDDTDLADLMTEIPLVPHRPRKSDPEKLVDDSRSLQYAWKPVPARTLLNSLGSVLYAVRLPDGLIKIGYTTNLNNRLLKLKSQKLLAFRFGDRADETAVHQSLSSHCARGREYYHPAPDVLAVVNRWRVDLGLPPEPV